MARFNLDSKKWDHISTMQNRSKFGIAQVGQEVYLLGGKRDKQRVAIGEVFAHGAVMQSWGLESVRSGFGTVVLNEEIHIIGGNDGDHILKLCERYSRAENTWKRLESLN